MYRNFLHHRIEWVKKHKLTSWNDLLQGIQKSKAKKSKFLNFLSHEMYGPIQFWNMSLTSNSKNSLP